jgi:hypothetical protein
MDKTKDILDALAIASGYINTTSDSEGESKDFEEITNDPLYMKLKPVTRFNVTV